MYVVQEQITQTKIIPIASELSEEKKKRRKGAQVRKYHMGDGLQGTIWLKSYIKISLETGISYVKSAPSFKLIEKLASMGVHQIYLPPSKWVLFVKRFRFKHKGQYTIKGKWNALLVYTRFGSVFVTSLGYFKKPIRIAALTKEIKDMYLSGMSGVQIAKHFGFPIRTVYNLLERLKLPGYKKRRFLEYYHSLKEKGEKIVVARLAREFGVSRPTIYKWVMDYENNIRTEVGVIRA